jgi:DNA-binding transcriptional LysR family regulator
MQNSIPSGHDAGKIIDLNDLRIFAYVASLTSFSLAADALQIHKSSVSRSIARLEAMLKTPLLQRTTRKVLLTQRGVDMRERCVDLLSHVDKTIGYEDDAGPRSLAVRPGIRYVNQARHPI